MSNDGYDNFEDGLTKVFASGNENAFLVFSGRDGSVGLLVTRGIDGSRMTITLGDGNRDWIDAIVKYCDSEELTAIEQGIGSDQDEVLRTSSVTYRIPDSPAIVAAVCTHILRDIVGIHGQEPMELHVLPNPF